MRKMVKLARACVFAVFCGTPTSCGMPERMNTMDGDSAISVAEQQCLMSAIPYIHECMFLVAADESVLRNETDTDGGLFVFTFVVANKEGYVRAQCEFSAPSKAWIFTEECAADDGLMVYRVAVREP